MVDYLQLLLLGAVAGFTIFLGLPIALVRNVSRRTRGFLSAVSIGILLFLVADVLATAWEKVKEATSLAYTGQSSISSAVVNLLALVLGLGLGMFMLTYYEGRYAKAGVASSSQTENIVVSRGHEKELRNVDHRQDRVVLQQQQVSELHGNPYRLATMIAMSIGLHNFAEGLAIGQSYASQETALAILLVIGFAVHNATEGFGIASPLAAIHERPSISFLVKMGLLGGGPTFLGTIVGSISGSPITFVLFLSLAAGALIYVSLFMYGSGRRQVGNGVMMTGIFIGVLAGILTDLVLSLGGA